jgi:hypothetical protein
MRPAALIRRGLVSTVLIGLAVQFGGAAAQGTPGGRRLNSRQAAVVCPVTKPDPLSTGIPNSPLATGASEQLQVTVPPLVLITLESGALRVSTNTGRAPAKTDEFYLIGRGRAGYAPAHVVKTVLLTCR